MPPRGPPPAPRRPGIMHLWPLENEDRADDPSISLSLSLFFFFFLSLFLLFLKVYRKEAELNPMCLCFRTEFCLRLCGVEKRVSSPYLSFSSLLFLSLSSF